MSQFLDISIIDIYNSDKNILPKFIIALLFIYLDFIFIFTNKVKLTFTFTFDFYHLMIQKYKSENKLLPITML